MCMVAEPKLLRNCSEIAPKLLQNCSERARGIHHSTKLGHVTSYIWDSQRFSIKQINYLTLSCFFNIF